jgi:tetratricopeptide (TPR) repeat protein
MELGLDFARTGRDEEALEAFASALTIPTATLGQAAQPMNEIAWLYQKSGRAAEALPLARLAVQIAPDNPAYLDTLAHAALKQGAYEDALDAAKRALEIAPGEADFLYTLALGLEAAGQKRGALARMEQAASSDARYEAALADLRNRVR